MAGSLGYEKIVVAVALLVLYAVGAGLTAWVLTATIALLMVALCVAEATLKGGPVRRREPAFEWEQTR
jgi:hypothetical protein